MSARFLALWLVPLALGLLPVPAAALGTDTAVPPPAEDQPLHSGAAPQTVVLAGGCFWGIQGVFQHLDGVTRAVSGYAGGAKDTAHYETVSTGRTGHAESVEVTFDPGVISLGTVLRVFFSVAHDPTQLNRQGPDAGTQYRSAIFVGDDAQQHLAEAYIAQLDRAGVFEAPIATQVTRLTAFYPAEAYHQDYATRHPEYPYIAVMDLPKIDALKRTFPTLYRATPVLVTP